ncbi:hypothetical protein BGZ63DRAFT_382371 [Mariannaea sp. PMI_226]|nr:hypothetical protein BGZ63DRAFT_382371 [Mariannaea sp. PMI_226]
MHQTSSRLLRMTDDDRPFTKVCIMSLQENISNLASPFYFLYAVDPRASRPEHKTPPPETLLSRALFLCCRTLAN